MKKLLAVYLLVLLSLGGCKKNTPHETVFVLDISASIDPGSKHQMFAAISDFATKLHRGDRLIVVPITGDADSDLSGRILDYTVPSDTDREAYDEDIVRLNTRMRDDLNRLEEGAAQHPSKHSDIIGSIRVALGKFSNRASGKELVVLSDFIQDDSQSNFLNDPSLRNRSRQGDCNSEKAIQHSYGPEMHIILGRLKSIQFSSMALGRQQAIDCYWHQHLWPAEINPDGLAGLNEVAHSDQ